MPLNLDAIGKKIGPVAKEYSWKDLVLYALGVGAGFDDLDYCYENNLKVIPTYAVASIFEFLAEAGLKSGANLAGILHGEQDTIFHQPIPTEGTLSTEGSITNIYDKGPGKGAIVVAKADTTHSNGQKLFTNIFTLFSRFDGGFGGENSPTETFEFPNHKPDFIEEASPSTNQPLLYRLSGDTFQLHIDPDFAKSAGFEKPIMHGLCTHGFACRAVIQHLIPGEPDRLTRFKTRFSKTLYPGTSIITQIWKINEGTVYFRVLNAKTQEVVIDRGIAEYMSSAEKAKRAKRVGIRFDDRVAIITGAGAGLGRVYALELAKRGAKIVVNDLGGSRDGKGNGSASAADTVVQEIQALGGEAIANYDSVATEAGGKAIVDAAVRAFGKVDILINNAGILRDKSLLKMETDDWKSVMDVHLNGAYFITKPAFLLMKEQGYGRIIMTTSAAGLFGNFGQTNYAAAKLALVGFMNTLKLEGQKYNVKVNCVAPVAATRLTEDLLPPEMLAKLKPEFVAPLVLFLCSEQCSETGGIYNAGMGFYSRAAFITGTGAVLSDNPNKVVQPEEILSQFDTITSLNGAKEHNDTMQFLAYMQSNQTSPNTTPAPSATQAVAKADAGEIKTVQDVIDRMPKAFQSSKSAGVDVIFQFHVSGKQSGDFSLKIKNQTCELSKGTHEKPTTTILMADEDLLAWMNKKLNAMQAYTTGKIKIKGDLMKSQLIEKLFIF